MVEIETNTVPTIILFNKLMNFGQKLTSNGFLFELWSNLWYHIKLRTDSLNHNIVKKKKKMIEIVIQELIFVSDL